MNCEVKLISTFRKPSAPSGKNKHLFIFFISKTLLATLFRYLLANYCSQEGRIWGTKKCYHFGYKKDTWLLVISWLTLMPDAMLVVFVTQAEGTDTQVVAALGMQSPLTVTFVAKRLLIIELDVVLALVSSLTITWICWDGD